MDKIIAFNNALREVEHLFKSNDNYLNEKLVEQSLCTNLINEKADLIKWYEEIASKKIAIETINLTEMKSWSLNSKEIFHDTEKFFVVKGVRISKNEREITTGWDQPIIQEINYDGGLLGLIRGIKDGLPHYLVEAKFEPGNYNQYQLSPTLQATFSNLEKAHGGREPNYYSFFKDYKENQSDYSFSGWLSEDGGRFYNKRNYGLVKTIDMNEVKIVNENFNWISLYQLKSLLKSSSIVNPHLLRLMFL